MSTALITGASSGIGMELAKLFAADGQDLVLIARSGTELQALAGELTSAAGVRVRIIAQDLASAEAPPEISAEIHQAGLAIDTLVNNAGMGVYGPFSATDREQELRMIQVNVTAVTDLTKQFLPGMLERRRGAILNVASTAAFQPGPLMAVYYATKAYVLSFSEALANELQGSGVSVTALCPGPTITQFQKRAGLEETRLFNSPLVMDARTVARAGYVGMKRGRRIVTPGVANKLLAQSVRIAPRRMVTAVTRAIQEDRNRRHV